MREEINKLLEARRVLTDKIANLNWDYTKRQELVLELNCQIAKIDEIITAFNLKI